MKLSEVFFFEKVWMERLRSRARAGGEEEEYENNVLLLVRSLLLPAKDLSDGGGRGRLGFLSVSLSVLHYTWGPVPSCLGGLCKTFFLLPFPGR